MNLPSTGNDYLLYGVSCIGGRLRGLHRLGMMYCSSAVGSLAQTVPGRDGLSAVRSIERVVTDNRYPAIMSRLQFVSVLKLTPVHLCVIDRSSACDSCTIINLFYLHFFLDRMSLHRQHSTVTAFLLLTLLANGKCITPDNFVLTTH